MTAPQVSVIIPVFNGEQFLREAIESALGQDYRPLEVVVVDDGSIDRTPEVARAFSDVRYLRQENGGAGAARNTGVAAAQGEIVSFLDHDDTWAPHKLTCQVDYLVSHPQIECVFTKHIVATEVDGLIPAWVTREKQAEKGPGIFVVTMAIWKRGFDRIGGFDPNYDVGEDTEWMARAADAGLSTALIDEPLLIRRIHEANERGPVADHHAALVRLIRASILRKRGQSGEPGSDT